MDDHLKINLKADEYEFNDPYRMCSIDRSPQTYNGHRELYDFNGVDKVFELVKLHINMRPIVYRIRLIARGCLTTSAYIAVIA